MPPDFWTLIIDHFGIIYKIGQDYFMLIEDQEDFRHDVVLKAHKAFPTFRWENKFSSWLHRVAVSVALDKKKAQRSKQYFVNRYVPIESEAIESSYCLQKCLTLITETERHLLLAYYSAWGSSAAIAAEYGMRKGTVSVKIMRIRNKIKNNYTTLTY